MNTSNTFLHVLLCKQHPINTNEAQALLIASLAFFGCCVPRRRASRHCRPTWMFNEALFIASLMLCMSGHGFRCPLRTSRFLPGRIGVA